MTSSVSGQSRAPIGRLCYQAISQCRPLARNEQIFKNAVMRFFFAVTPTKMQLHIFFHAPHYRKKKSATQKATRTRQKIRLYYKFYSVMSIPIIQTIRTHTHKHYKNLLRDTAIHSMHVWIIINVKNSVFGNYSETIQKRVRIPSFSEARPFIDSSSTADLIADTSSSQCY